MPRKGSSTVGTCMYGHSGEREVRCDNVAELEARGKGARLAPVEETDNPSSIFSPEGARDEHASPASGPAQAKQAGS